MDSVMSDLTTELVKLFFAIVAPILATLLGGLLVQALRKIGIQIDEAKKAQVNSLLFKLIAQTEEWASVRIKNGMTITAQDKAEHYVALAAEKLPNVSAEEAVAVSKQVLGTARLAGTAVLKDLRVAVEK